MSLSDARKMSAKEQFDGCMRQARFISQKMYSRQTYQWKVTIGLWTLFSQSPSRSLPEENQHAVVASRDRTRAVCVHLASGHFYPQLRRPQKG